MRWVEQLPRGVPEHCRGQNEIYLSWSFTVCMHLSVYQGKPAGYQSWHVLGFTCLDR